MGYIGMAADNCRWVQEVSQFLEQILTEQQVIVEYHISYHLSIMSGLPSGRY
jgi:hypothetical protein